MARLVAHSLTAQTSWRRRVGLFCGLIVLALVFTGLVFALPVFGQANPEEERSRFLSFVEDQISGPGRIVRFTGINGALSSDASFDEITIADDEGVWLRIVDASITWQRTALLRGRLEVESLRAARIDIARGPVASDAVPSAEAGGFSIPQLPVAVLIETLHIERVELGEPLFGIAAALSLNGQIALADGNLDTALAMDRLDGPGGALSLEASFDAQSTRLDLALGLREPANGLVAGAIGIPGRPPIALMVEGEGPLDALAAQLRLDADGMRVLDGVLQTEALDDGTAFALTLDGPLERLVDPGFADYFGATTMVTAQGQTFEAGGMVLRALTVDSGALRLSASAQTTPDGFPAWVDVDATLAPLSGQSLPLPFDSSGATLSGARLVASLPRSDNGDASKPWLAELLVSGLETQALALGAVSLDATGLITNLNQPDARALSFSSTGATHDLSFSDPGAQQAVGGEITFQAQGDWQANRPLMIERAQLLSQGLDIGFAGQIADATLSGQTRFVAGSLAPFGTLAGRALGGSLDLDMTGDIAPLSGAFNLAFEGQGNGLRTGVDAVDSLLAGITALTGRVERSENGLGVEALRLASTQLDALLDGLISSQRTDLELTARLADLRSLSIDMEGAANLSARLDGANGPLAITSDITIADGRLRDSALREARLGFAGILNEGVLTGTLDGAALLGTAPVDLSGQIVAGPQLVQVSDLILQAPGAQLSAALERPSSGLIIGDIALAAPDISTLARLALLEARGALNADISLSGTVSQSADITATLGNLVVDGNRVQSGQINAQIDDLFGALAVQGSATLSGIAAGDIDIASATVNASRAGTQTRLDLAARAISVPALVQTGIGALNADGTVRLAGQMATLDGVTLAGPGGLGITLSGTVPFNQRNVQLAVRGVVPLALANQSLANRGTRFSGTAQIDGRVEGSFGAPQLRGTLSLDGAQIVDPLSQISLSGVQLAMDFDGQTARIANARANVNGSGQLSLQGTIGLDAGLPAELDVTLANLAYPQTGLVSAQIGGAFSVTGQLLGSPLIAGTVQIGEAEITLPSSFTSAVGAIEVAHINPSSRVQATFERAGQGEASGTSGGSAGAARLDVTVNAPGRIFVRGRGLDAELGGQVQLTGRVNAIRPVGAFSLVRGRFSILGQRIELDEGSVTLVGDLDPFISLTARTNASDLVASITISGRVSAPTIALSSQPTLPDDEILARIIFNRGLNELSPLQIAQLAAAAAELAGTSNGSALGSIRDGLGLDDLDIVTDDSGNAAVRASRYVQENIYVGVEAASDGRATATINLDIAEDVTARGSVSSDGESRVGVFFERDY